MKTCTQIYEMKNIARDLKRQGKRIGLVPTMGYLHEGHLSLVRECVEKADRTVVSVFVNPTQFGPDEDFRQYPRDLERDSEILEKEGVDYLFSPDTGQVYPQGFKTYVEVNDLQDKLCGRSRIGHFRGVCTVILKLFNILDPDLAFFGQKDAQQAIILKKMAQDLDLDVKIEVLPIVREEDGLALSSRNGYLNPEQRRAALSLSRSLREVQQMIDKGERNTTLLKQKMQGIINSESLARIDYIEIVDMENLDPLPRIERGALIAIAVYIGKVRLIDNVIVCLEE